MELIRRFWRYLKPFHRQFTAFIALTILFESIQIIEAYTISLVIRVFSLNVDTTFWIIFFVGLIIFDEMFIRLDNFRDWYIACRIIDPIYSFLKMAASAKFLGLSLPWHERHNSGALVEKVNKGAEKVGNITQGLSWELIPTMIQTCLSLIPLTFISPIASGIAIIGFSLFAIQSIKLTKALDPVRKSKYDLYEQEGHESVEMVQAVETIVMFDQTSQVLANQQSIHDQLIKLGQKEARFHIYTYGRRRSRILSITRRLILAIWIWQLYQGSLDIANLFFVNVLVEKLINSFWRMSRLYDRLAEASEGAKRLIDLLETPAAAK